MLILRQSTASQEVLLGPFLDDTDGKTPETGLTIAATDIKLWKAGATSEANKNSGGATHIASGRYYAVLDATDTNTLGSGEINVHVSGALPVRRAFLVLAANAYDAMIGGGDYLQVDMAQVLGVAAQNRYLDVIEVVTTGSPSTTSHPFLTGSLSTQANAFAGSTPQYAKYVTGANAGIKRRITASSHVTDTTTLTTAAFPTAPSAGDTLLIVGIDHLGESVAEPAGPFAWASAKLRDIVNYLGAKARNKQTQTATTYTLRNNADDADIATATVSDNGTTATKGADA